MMSGPAQVVAHQLAVLVEACHQDITRLFPRGVSVPGEVQPQGGSGIFVELGWTAQQVYHLFYRRGLRGWDHHLQPGHAGLINPGQALAEQGLETGVRGK
jgi:hypothetical protein